MQLLTLGECINKLFIIEFCKKLANFSVQRSKSVIRTTLTSQTNPRVIDFDSKENYCDKNKTRLW